eukprot:TRINITY_DN373_c0_g2_i1.p1 TRINITY_DN373_c0_g2~~TRINITY_DN373_c0_g2_i1.p1  ORF type:complete len:101 (+),score=23.90 TRINITY_DN373_c0_g2_i1:285-587(+)
MSQGAEAKKEEFQKYLDRAGVVDALTKVLVGLYESPAPPPNALDFIKETLGSPSTSDIEKMQQTIAEQAQLIKEKDEIIAGLKQQIEDLKGKPTEEKKDS